MNGNSTIARLSPNPSGTSRAASAKPKTFMQKHTEPALKPLPEPSAKLLRTALIESYFSPFSARISTWAGGHAAFMLAFALVIVWAAFGPVTHFSNDWMLVINTSTTIITFLMVFIIQSSQNRDTRALQVKIDELLRATKGASNSLMDLEQLTPTEITKLHDQYLALAAKARELGLDFDLSTPKMEKLLVEEAKAADAT
jgi:low affinity Fe/Cu permease